MKLERVLLLLISAAIYLPEAPLYAQSVLPDDYAADEPKEEEPAEEPADEPEEDEPKPKPKPKPKKASEPAKKADSVEAKKKIRPKLKNRRRSSGLGFTLTVGGLSTLRRMNFAGSDHSIKHRPGVYLGGVIQATQHILLLKESKSHVLLEAEGGFGSAKNAEVEPALGRQLTTEHAYLVVLGMFERPIHPDIDLRLGLGMSALSYTVEPNPDYTGHRYISLAASFGAAYWVSPKTKLGGNLVFLPGLGTNQSAGGYGAARSFGGRGEAYLAWRFLQPDEPDLFGAAELGARYSYARFQTSLPETQLLGDLATTSDVAHTLTLFVSYNL